MLKKIKAWKYMTLVFILTILFLIVFQNIVPVSATTYTLTFSHYDNRDESNPSGTHFKQMLIGDTVVWERDVTNDPSHEWYTEAIDITQYVQGSTDVDLRLRVYEKAAVGNYNISVYWDDISLNGFTISNNGFESESSWTYSESGTGFYGEYSTSEYKSGSQSYHIRLPESTQTSIGDYGCITQNISSTAWFAKNAFTEVHNLGSGNSGVVTAEFDVTPLYDDMAGVIGYADTSTTVSGYSSLAAIVSIETSGYFQARNGSSYSRDATVNYSANSTFNVRIVANTSAETYDVYITPESGSETQIADDYAFRTDAPATDDLGKVCLQSNSGDNYFKVENHTIAAATPTPTCSPTPSPTPFYILEFSHYDNRDGDNPSGTHYKQVLIDDTVVWESDVTDDSKFEWHNESIDVTQYVQGNPSVDVILRVYENAAVGNYNVSVYWDDISLNGFTISNNGFESESSWTYSESGTGFYGEYSTSEYKSGLQSYHIRLPESTQTSAGDYGCITQTVSNSDEWFSKEAFTEIHNIGNGNTGVVSLEYDLTPLYTEMSGVIGYADTSTTISYYDDLAVIVAIDPLGYFTARNGDTYENDATVNYTANAVYNVRIEADMNGMTYDVFITPDGGSETQIADNYLFREDAPDTDDLGKVCLQSSSGDSYFKIKNHTVLSATPTPSPTPEDTPASTNTPTPTDTPTPTNTPTATPTPSPSTAWYSQQDFSGIHDLGPGNTEQITVEFDVTPLYDDMPGVIGYADSSTTVSGYTDLAAIVSMETEGYFQARNGSYYDRDATVNYSANTTYGIKIEANTDTQTYDVYITPDGGSETQIADDYAFRTDAPFTDDFGKVCLQSSDGDNYFRISNHSISSIQPTPSPSPTPDPSMIWYADEAFTEVHSLGSGNEAVAIAEFDVIPLYDNIEGVIGYADASTTISGFTDLAPVVSLESEGYFQVMNGNAYTRDRTVYYTANTKYHVRVHAHLFSERYDVEITPEGGETVRVAVDYLFRTNAPATNDIGKVCLQSNSGDDSFRIEQHTITNTASTYGHTANPTGDPLGGGAGYSDIISASEADYVVSTLSGLVNALSSAAAGDIVYVEGTASIDMSSRGTNTIDIPAGVTIASNRGQSGSSGGLIYSNYYMDSGTMTMFDTLGTDVRITGLRIRGNDGEIGDSPYEPGLCIGIRANPSDSGFIEVDNCEIYNCSFVGVYVKHAYIHHCHFHHCWRTGFGYPVYVSYGPGPCVIEACEFDHYRHAIAARGPYSSNLRYTARYNLCTDDATSHAFDQHGYGESGHYGGVAGDRHLIYHNTFQYTSKAGFKVRGDPVTGSWVDYNWFYRDTPYEECFVQQCGEYRTYAGKNAYGQNKDVTSGAIDYDPCPNYY